MWLTLCQVVLEGRSRQHDASLRLDFTHCFRQRSLLVLQHVTLVADDDVRTGVDETAGEDVALRFLLDVAVTGEIAVHLVTHDEDATFAMPLVDAIATTVHVFLHLCHLVHFGSDARWHPLHPLVVPVEDCVEGTDDETSVDLGATTVVEESVCEGDHLQNPRRLKYQ